MNKNPKTGKFENKNIIIFNSCTVTSEAEKQLRQAIRKARKEDPKSIIGVVGCAAQTNSKAYESMEEVDFVFGNIDKMKENNYELKEWLPEKQKSLYTKYDILGDVLDSTGK